MSMTYTSAWKDRLQDTVQKILNRESFSYDINADALYRQYKDSYLRQGRQAMEDTMGRSAALTGGYGNSYAQTAAQQTYQGYLQQLNDRIPQLQSLALQRYNAENARLQNNAGILMQQENLDYSRYRDAVADRNDTFDRLLALMTEYGYRPSEQEMAAGGMTADHVLAILGPENPVAAAVSRSGYTGGSSTKTNDLFSYNNVLRAQKMLNDEGWNVEESGIFDFKTRKAYAEYNKQRIAEQKEKQKQTGK